MLNLLKTTFFITLFIFLVFGQTCPGNCNSHGTCSSGVCTCSQSWTGNDCSISLQTLNSGQPIAWNTPAWTWNYFVIENSFSGSALKVDIVPASVLDSLSDCDIYVRKDEFPTSGSYDAANIQWGTTATLIVQHADAARYYIGVFSNFIRCNYRITATLTGACPQGCNNGGCSSNGTCFCNPGWGGPTCDKHINYLPFSTITNGEVEQGAWSYYQVILNKEYYLHVNMNITSIPPEQHDCDLYVRKEDPPSFLDWDYKDASTDTAVTLDIPTANAGIWYIGVWGYKQCNYNLQVTQVTGCFITQCSAHGVCTPPCQCDFGYSGEFCDMKQYSLLNGMTERGYVAQESWNYYIYSVDGSQDNIIIRVDQDNPNGDCDLYVRLGNFPTRNIYDYVDISTNSNFHIEIEDAVLSTLYIGVFGWKSVGYNLTITKTNTCPNGCAHGQCIEGATCLCDPGWLGTDCNIQSSNWLISGQMVRGTINDTDQWIYYQFHSTATTVIVSMKEEGYQNTLTGALYLFVAEDQAPTLRSYNYFDMDLNKQFHTIQMTLDNQQYKQSNWTIGVYGSIYVGPFVTFELVYWEPQL